MGKSFWDRLAWIVLALIAIWVLLKVFGVIKTPLWLEYAPIYGVVYLAGWAMKKLDSAIKDISDLKDEIKPIQSNLNQIAFSCPIFAKK